MFLDIGWLCIRICSLYNRTEAVEVGRKKGRGGKHSVSARSKAVIGAATWNYVRRPQRLRTLLRFGSSDPPLSISVTKSFS